MNPEEHEAEAMRLVDESNKLAAADPNLSGEERHRRRQLLLDEAQVHAILARR
jgi:hypothetical protein